MCWRDNFPDLTRNKERLKKQRWVVEISDTHVLPVIFLLPHPVVLVVHPFMANLAVRLQGGLLLVAHVDHTHAPVGGKK